MEIINYFEYNSLITLSYFFICLIVLILNSLSKGKLNLYLFSTSKASLLNPRTYIGFFTHIIGHEDWDHFSNNFMKILILGPMLEEKYGSIIFLIMILLTALITALFNFVRGKARIYGASGIAFMLTVLSSFVNIVDKKIPITFVLIILFYIIDEIKRTFDKKDTKTSHSSHLIGALCGAIFGYLFMNEDIKNIIMNVIK